MQLRSSVHISTLRFNCNSRLTAGVTVTKLVQCRRKAYQISISRGIHFIGYDYKEVGYLGEEGYDMPDCSLI